MKAFFELDNKKVIEQYNKIKKLGIISYSYKTNSLIGDILKKQTNSEFNIHNLEEFKSLNCPKRTWYIPISWDLNEAKKVLEKGINKFIIENKHDLNILNSALKNQDKKITLLLRIKIRENTIFTGKYFVYGFSTEIARDLIEKYKEKKYIKKIGIHFHRKTENTSEWRIIDELKDSFDFEKIDIVNIGGGLPIKYQNIKNFNIEDILKQISELKEFLKTKKTELIIEPGRFIAGPAIKLITEIINKDNKNITINCSLYNSSPDTLLYSIRLLIENESEEGKEFLIKGNTPDSLDIFRYRVKFKEEPKIGDKIIFINAGAYNFHTEYFFLPKIKTKIINN